MIETFDDYKWAIFSLAVLFAGLMLFLRTRLERKYKNEVSSLENFDASSLHIAAWLFSYFAIDTKRRSIALRGIDKLHRFEANEILEFTPNLKDLKLANRPDEKKYVILHVFTKNPDHPEFTFTFLNRKKAVKAIQALSNLTIADTQLEQQQQNNKIKEFRTKVLTELEQSNIITSEAQTQTNEFRSDVLTKLADAEKIQSLALDASLQIDETLKKTNKKAGEFTDKQLNTISKLESLFETNGFTRETLAAAKNKLSLLHDAITLASREFEEADNFLNKTSGYQTLLKEALKPSFLFSSVDDLGYAEGSIETNVSTILSQIRKSKNRS